MRFRLIPSEIRKDSSFEAGVLDQTIQFTAQVITGGSHNDQSTLLDGRKIDSLPCSVLVTMAQKGGLHGVFVFDPEYVSTQVEVSSSSDGLSVEAYLQPELFHELWHAVAEHVRIVFFGAVAGMTSATSWSLSPYKWDAANEQERVKDLASFGFSVITRTAVDAGKMFNIECETGFKAISVRDDVEKRYNRYGQMRHLSLKAVGQAEAEALRLGFTHSEIQHLAEEAVTLINNAHTSVRAPQSEVKEINPELLWVHQNLQKTFTEGRTALGHWDVGQTQLHDIARELMNCPWLRMDALEWAIVDALVFREVFEFGETVKSDGSFAGGWAYAMAKGNLKRMPWERLKVGGLLWLLRWGLLCGGMWVTWAYFTDREIETWPSIRILAGTFFVLYFLLIGLPIGKKAARQQKQKRIDLLQKMNDAYVTLRQNDLLSPNQIRAALLAAQNDGAIWDSAALALLDRAAARDPPVWLL